MRNYPLVKSNKTKDLNVKKQTPRAWPFLSFFEKLPRVHFNKTNIERLEIRHAVKTAENEGRTVVPIAYAKKTPKHKRKLHSGPWESLSTSSRIPAAVHRRRRDGHRRKTQKVIVAFRLCESKKKLATNGRAIDHVARRPGEPRASYRFQISALHPRSAEKKHRILFSLDHQPSARPPNFHRTPSSSQRSWAATNI